jgi:hypothetical protein
MPAHFFQLVNLIAIAAWVIMIGFPARKNTSKGIINGVILVLCLFYFSLIINWITKGAVGGFDSLASVMLLFKDQKAMLAGWIHYLAFDLFVGLWITQNAQLMGVKRWVLIVIQLFTFMFGPIGLGLYMIIRRHKTGEFISGL